MYLFPPLTIAPAELDELLAILGASVDAVLAGG
jgi:adenosylmethionine-8-amino-7-oxononanoate aminotransferase